MRSQESITIDRPTDEVLRRFAYRISGFIFILTALGAQSVLAASSAKWTAKAFMPLPRHQHAAADHGDGDARGDAEEHQDRKILGQQRLGHDASTLVATGTIPRTRRWDATQRRPVPQRNARGH